MILPRRKTFLELVTMNTVNLPLKPSCNVVLLRHSITPFNIEKRLQGQEYDIALSQEGIEKARSLNLALKLIHFDVLITSPMKRACETGEILRGSSNIDLKRASGLEEIDHGSWNGMSEQELLTDQDFQKWKRNPNYRQKNGETLEVAKKRILPAFGKIIEQNWSDGKATPTTVVVVCHLWVNRIILSTLTGSSLNRCHSFSQPNCGGHLIQFYSDQTCLINDLTADISRLVVG